MGMVATSLKRVARPAGEDSPWHGAPSVDGEYGFLRGLINGMRCGLLAIDRDGRVVMTNDLGNQILGLDEAPRPGTPVQEALRDHLQVAHVLCESFTMASLPNRAEIDLSPDAAAGKTIGFTLSLIPGGDGEPAGAAMFFKDLTRIEQKEEQQRLKNRLAELGQMAASLAHEIRNPLASIDVTCTLLKRRLGPESDGVELLEKINAEVRRLNHTISSSLEFVRPVSLDLARAELSSVLHEAIRVARRRRGRPEIEIRLLGFPGGIRPFLMDRDQLRQVFENLIINALEAISVRGVVTIEAGVVPAPDVMSVPYEPEGHRDRDPWHSVEELAVVRVSDSGPGIGEEERDKIFYPFFTTKKQGSGVGLAMVKKIVGSHRGLIDVDTSPLGGARFTVRLPMVQVRPEEEPR